MSHPLASGVPPAWAVAWGQDAFGVYATFEVAGVSQRMRWIPPGTFRMGSPAEEVGRYAEREARHLVTLTHGYWLADTPVTQALLMAVLGDNPSRSKGGERPVERVSWWDANRFCVALGERVPGLEPRLPTEAEWERACRAGSDTATWLGDVGDTQSDSTLDSVAWYVANSGSETHSVGDKASNPLGLYDMLGNVLEWCHDKTDWPPRSADESEVDPLGTDGSERVIRGGSWGHGARNVRAAYRDAYDPVYRYVNLGFRLAGGPTLQGRSPVGPEGPSLEAEPERPGPGR